MNLSTVMAAIQAGVSLIPEGAALISEIKAMFATHEVAQIDAALAAANAAADAQHNEAQGL